jgi:NAD(P)-dependent dehydrogenase (short-subunit alcohol dehydrogenase family)
VIPHADLHALDDDFFGFVLAGNLRGPFATVRACRSMLEASGDGPVVNVGPVSGVRGGGQQHRLCRTARDNPCPWRGPLAPAIRVVAVVQSLMQTPMTEMWTSQERAQGIAQQPAQTDRRARGGGGGDPGGLATTMTVVNGTASGRRRQPVVKILKG